MHILNARTTASLCAAALAVTGVAAAQPMTFSGHSASEPPPAFPKSTAAVPPNAADMQAVLDAQASLGPQPIETLSPGSKPVCSLAHPTESRWS